MNDIPATVHVAIDAALASAVQDLRTGTETPGHMNYEMGVCAAVSAQEVARTTQDPQALAATLVTLDEALRAISADAHRDAPIRDALGRLEAARMALSPHLAPSQAAPRIERAFQLLRELHQVLGELHVRLFLDAGTRDHQAPLVQLVRDDVNLLRQQFDHGGKFGNPWQARDVVARIHAELMALEVHDERSDTALTHARELVAGVLDVAGSADP